MNSLKLQIEKHLICQICQKEYKDPRNVSCGKSFCQKCIEFQTDREQSLFKCICGKKHTVPDPGFPVNELVAVLLEKNTVKTYPKQPAEDLIIKEIKQKIDELDFGFKFSQDKIKNYFDEIKRQIDIETETMIQSIQNQRDKLFEWLKCKEEAYVSHLSYKLDTKEEIGKSIKELHNLYNNFENKSNGFQMDQKDIRRYILELSFEIKKFELELNKYLFNKEQFIFEKDLRSQESINIGKIKCKPIELSLNLDKLQSIDLKDFISFHADFDYFNNGDVLICQALNNKKIELRVINQNTGRVIKQKHFAYISGYICSLRCHIHKSDKFALFMVNFTDKTSVISIIDPKNLTILTTQSYLSEIAYIHLNTDYIYALLSSNVMRILPYDLLNPRSHIIKFPKHRLAKHNSNTICFQVNDEHLFEYLDDGTLSISSLSDKKNIASNLVAGKLCTIYADSYIVTYDSNNRCLYYYDFKGDYAGSQRMPNDIEPTIIKCKNDMIFFYDEIRYKLHFLKKH